jgi:hypothetical protein
MRDSRYSGVGSISYPVKYPASLAASSMVPRALPSELAPTMPLVVLNPVATAVAAAALSVMSEFAEPVLMTPIKSFSKVVS